MSGRGKGGKGLGKGGAKRHRKVLRDNIPGEQFFLEHLVFSLFLSRHYKQYQCMAYDLQSVCMTISAKAVEVAVQYMCGLAIAITSLGEWF